MEQIEILFEDNHLIAINKPAGLLVQGDQTGDEPLSEMVKGFLKEKYKKPGNVFCGVIHRLDRPVSGVLVFAKTSKGLERMNALFQEKKITKKYWALVQQRPPAEEELLEHWLVKDHDKNTTRAYDKLVKGGTKASLTYKLIGKVNRHYLLEVIPATGRPHQIRAQLGKIGCPIKGDMKYGSTEKSLDGRIYLHALSLSFLHPIKKEQVLIKADLPKGTDWDRYRQLESEY